MNVPDIIVMTVLAITIGLAIFGAIRNRKKGCGCGCGGSCSGCGLSENCKDKK
ncbi:MAG: FeoB-associated Cys-rich membrane protein [Lachnospiraceae bacterium]|nr:FeoB-associated Cys-rich membrane protein [Lachnospiraceae bacterium]